MAVSIRIRIDAVPDRIAGSGAVLNEMQIIAQSAADDKIEVTVPNLDSLAGPAKELAAMIAQEVASKLFVVAVGSKSEGAMEFRTQAPALSSDARIRQLYRPRVFDVEKEVGKESAGVLIRRFSQRNTDGGDVLKGEVSTSEQKLSKATWLRRVTGPTAGVVAFEHYTEIALAP